MGDVRIGTPHPRGFTGVAPAPPSGAPADRLRLPPAALGQELQPHGAAWIGRNESIQTHGCSHNRLVVGLQRLAEHA